MALSEVLGHRPDRELLYIAAQLHDLGLTAQFDGEGPFELRGADAAYAWCREHDVPESKAELIHEAICLHTSLVAARREPEIALVHFGAGADVIGYHLEDIHPRTVEAILELWPRDGFKREVHALLGEQARKNPDSPAGAQWRLGFGKRILAAPFAQ